MKIKFFTLSALVLAFGAAACTNTAADLPPGKYEKTTRSVDAYGTETERNVSTEVEQDKYGNKKATVESKTTKDPEGLFNKETTSKTKTTVTKKAE